MKVSHVLGAAGLFILAGCGPRGGVEFDYVLLLDDGAGGIIAADSCGSAGVDSVRYAVGVDLDGNNVLDDVEENDSFEFGCNQNDANLDGSITEDEFGQVLINRVIDAGTYDSFSISFLDGAGNFVPWAQAPAPGANIFTFGFQGDDGNFTRGDVNQLIFAGGLAQELQVFVNF
jgi:hypothetical protein